MSANPLEWIYGSFSFGIGSSTGQAWLVQTVEGLFLPEYRYETVPKGGADGAWTYAGVLSEEHIILSGEYVAGDGTMATAVQDMLGTWAPAFAPVTTDQYLEFNYPGLGPQQIACKPINRHFDQDRLFSLGYTNWVVELVAGDPTIWSIT